jgi:hypothetical protein
MATPYMAPESGDIGTAPPWMRTKPMQVGTTPAPAPTNPNDPTVLYRNALAQAGQQTQAGAQNQANFDSGISTPPAPMASAPGNTMMGAGSGGNPGMADGMPPISGTTGIDVNNVQPWKGGPDVANTRVGAGDLPPVSTDFSADAQRGADAAYKGATQFFDQDFARERDAKQAQLINQGFAPGSQAFETEMGNLSRQQDLARTNAGLQAQGVGFDQSGQLLARALQTRAQLRGERTDDADRTFGQSLATANLGLGARGQDTSLQAAKEGASASTTAAGINAGANQYSTDVNGNIALQRLGMEQGNSNISNLIQLINSTRGGVNMPNFGAPQPLDVTGANSIASSNSNNAANRTAANNAVLAQLGGAALGSYFGK